MAYTEIYVFDRNGEAHHKADIPNAFRGGWAVWREMEKRHLPQYVPDYIKDCWWYHPNITAKELEMYLHYLPSRVTDISGNKMMEVWTLADKEEVPEHERIVMLSTMDDVLVRKEDLPRVIEAFRKFEGDTNLPDQADVLEMLLQDDDCIAVGWNQTSVNCDTWSTIGGYDEEKEECLPYNCLTMDKHFWLFDELDNEEEDQ